MNVFIERSQRLCLIYYFSSQRHFTEKQVLLNLRFKRFSRCHFNAYSNSIFIVLKVHLLRDSKAQTDSNV